MVSDLEKDALESKILSTQVTNLLAEKKELNDKLEERDRRILALREESNVIVRKNHDLEAKFGHQPKSKTRDFVKTLSDQAQKMKDLQAHIEMQSRAIVNLKDEHNVSSYTMYCQLIYKVTLAFLIMHALFQVFLDYSFGIYE